MHYFQSVILLIYDPFAMAIDSFWVLYIQTRKNFSSQMLDMFGITIKKYYFKNII